MKKYIGLLFAMLVMVSCESLEDTYEDFAGNGPVRYLGKCTDLTIQPGWNRLQVRWTNSPDPVIRHIRITWSKDAMVKEELVDRETSEYDITDLEDGSYEVTICAVDKNGNTSLESTDYGKPRNGAGFHACHFQTLFLSRSSDTLLSWLGRQCERGIPDLYQKGRNHRAAGFDQEDCQQPLLYGTGRDRPL